MVLLNLKPNEENGLPPVYTSEDRFNWQRDSVDSKETKRADYEEYAMDRKGLSTTARVTQDGRIAISLNLAERLPDLPVNRALNIDEFAIDRNRWKECPALSIVVMIVGSRGDVQPYIALGKELTKDGHRVRLATHETFRSLVIENGLEFFNIGGNSQDLMSYMVKNSGMIPGVQSMRNGDITKNRRQIKEMINGCWQACYERCPITGKTFAADAIISNPPAFAHIHCAEALGIPLHLSFTMPWSPTASFPHPLVSVNSTNAERGLTNVLSYALAELFTWQGFGDIINNFRTKKLGLQSLSKSSGPGLADRLKVPWTYCMSPALVPKPADWMNNIDVVGNYFLDLATAYTPSKELLAFLAAGPAPVYIGFGSVVVEDTAALIKIIFDATKQAGVRVLLSINWSDSVPPHVFLSGNIPHDWLFSKERVRAVIHHGGAGTTAAGLAKGRPTLVVPFFGDQMFWGRMVHEAGAGPAPIPYKKLTVNALRDGIAVLLSPGAQNSARALAIQMHNENGVKAGVDSFYKHLPLLNMRCDVDSSRLAVWWSKEYCLKLSAAAAQVLSESKELNINSLEPHRTMEYDTRKKITDPVTGSATAIFWTIADCLGSVGQIFTSPRKGIVNTTTAIPRSIAVIVSNFHEGFHNAPRLYGSRVRDYGKVTDLASGLKAAGKGAWYGYYDAITGIVREPMRGAKEEGFVGALKGSGRAFNNLYVQPIAGSVGLVVHPVNGAWKELMTAFRVSQEGRQRATRISDGIGAAYKMKPEQRAILLERFKELRVVTAERANRLNNLARTTLLREEQNLLVEPERPSESKNASTPSYERDSKEKIEERDEVSSLGDAAISEQAWPQPSEDDYGWLVIDPTSPGPLSAEAGPNSSRPPPNADAGVRTVQYISSSNKQPPAYSDPWTSISNLPPFDAESLYARPSHPIQRNPELASIASFTTTLRAEESDSAFEHDMSRAIQQSLAEK